MPWVQQWAALPVKDPDQGIDFVKRNESVGENAFKKRLNILDALNEDFQKGFEAQMNGAEYTLKHSAGHYGPGHMAAKGSIIKVTHASGEIPLGSSGIRLQFETDLIIEGIRPGRIVRVRPQTWPKMQVPREEYLLNPNPEDRFPTATIFPKY